MDNTQTNRVNMFKTVAAQLDSNNSIWNGMVPLAAAVTLFKVKIEAIDNSAQKQTTPSGASEDKESARDRLEDVLFLICEALGVLAHNSSDHDLSVLTDVTPSTLQRFDAEGLSNRAATIAAEATARKPALVTLQVTQANLDELDDALQRFNQTKVKPRSATSERTVQTQSLSTLVREASGILRDQIDRMVSLFRRSHPEFVAEYRSARVIVNRAASHRTTKPATTTPPPTT
jgi:hypothetical protein